MELENKSTADLQQELDQRHKQVQSLIDKQSSEEGLTDEEQANLNLLFDESDDLMDQITTRKNALRAQRQQAFMQNQTFLTVDTRPGEYPSESGMGQPSEYRDEGQRYPEISNRERFFINQAKPSKAPRITMRAHHGGLQAFTRGEKDVETAFRIGMFLSAAFLKNQGAQRWCKENGLMYMNQHVESVQEAGGIFVPEEMSERIIDLRDSFNVYRNNAYIEPMTSDTKNIARRKRGYTAKHAGETKFTDWQDPNLWDKVNLVAKKVEVPTKLSIELDMDSAVNIVDLLVTEAAEAFSIREDEDGFNGTGTSESGGIWGILAKLNSGNYKGAVPAAAGHNTFLTIDNDDLIAMLAQMPTYTRNRAGNRWYMSGYAYEITVGRLSLNAGGNRISDVAEGWTPTFYGYPVEFTEVLPGEGDLTGLPMLGFGNLALSSTMGDRLGMMMVRASEHALFTTDEIALKMTERYDIVNHNIGDDVKAGPFVTLIGSA